MTRPWSARSRRRPWPPATACARPGARWRSAPRRTAARPRGPGAASATTPRCPGTRAGARSPPGPAPGSPCGPPRRRRSSGRHPGVLGVAVGLELVGELLAALLDDLAADEDVHEVGLDVAQDPGVVRDEQRAGLAARADPVDALGHDPQRVDVEPGVGLVEDGDLRLQKLELQDLVTLLLATGEALVDVARREGRIHLESGHRRLLLLHPVPQG